MASIPLDNLAQKVWLFCLNRRIFLSAVHIPGSENIHADFYSRNFSNSTEWMLKDQIFVRICKHYFTPDIDLFASRLNKKLDKFMSWFPEPGCSGSDAFSVSWKEFSPYLFPPFCLIGKAVNKVCSDNVEQAILVFPYWKSQSWFPLVVSG